jgi:transposase-like protein
VIQSIPSTAIFRDAEKARAWLEARLWKEGPICPRCGAVDKATLMQGRSHRAGLYQCNICRQPFTIIVGTPCEQSKIPLNKWLAAAHLLTASTKRTSALQVGRTIGVSKKTAWFLCHRIRKSVFLAHGLLTDGESLVAETDQTYPAPMDDRQASKPRNNSPFTKGGGTDPQSKRADTRLVERGDSVGSRSALHAQAVTLANSESAKESAATGRPEDRDILTVDSEDGREALDIASDPSSQDDWIDLISVLDDKIERNLLIQMQNIAQDVSRSMQLATKTNNPDVAKNELKDAIRAIKNIVIVLKTLDGFRHTVGQKKAGVRGSNARAKKWPAVKKAALAKSDRLLQEFLVDHIEYLNTLERQYRAEARSLRINPFLPPRRDARGKPVGQDRSNWEAKYSALANDLVGETAKLLRSSFARHNRVKDPLI